MILSLVCDILITFLGVIMFQAIDYTCGFDIWRQCNFVAVVFIKRIFVHKAFCPTCVLQTHAVIAAVMYRCRLEIFFVAQNAFVKLLPCQNKG